MSLHMRCIDCRDLQVSLPKPHGKKAKANQQLSAQKQATYSFIRERGRRDSELVLGARIYEGV